MAMDQDRMVVGKAVAPNNGGVYVFELTNSVWMETAYIQQRDYSVSFSSVDVDGEQIIVGAPGMKEKVWAAFVYELSDNGMWGLFTTIHPLDATESFGDMTAISGDHMAIGALYWSNFSG